MRYDPGFANGKWKGILGALGMPALALSGKHGPCPMCGGVDRFRFINTEGRGTYICNQCGGGDGMALVQAFRGVDFQGAKELIGGVIGSAVGEPEKVGQSEEQRRAKLRDLSKASRSVEKGDAVDRYLMARGLGEPVAYPKALRCHPDLWYSEGKSFPAMLAVVFDVEGKPVSLHRTWLGDGEKALVDEPRRIMPGPLPEGACVRLSDVQGQLGLAEGIETALAASIKFQMPVWSCLNAPMLAKWEPPRGVESITIFGDNDENFTGQAAAYTLARRMVAKKLEVAVRIPDKPGTDWADE